MDIRWGKVFISQASSKGVVCLSIRFHGRVISGAAAIIYVCMRTDIADMDVVFAICYSLTCPYR